MNSSMTRVDYLYFYYISCNFVVAVIRCGGSRSKKRKVMYTAKKNAGTFVSNVLK